MLPRAVEPYQTISIRIPWPLFLKLDAYVREHTEASKVRVVVDALTQWFDVEAIRAEAARRRLGID